MLRSLGLVESLRDYFDNSTENLGNATSFAWYGPRWANAATAPSRGFKGYTSEGGIRCPCIVSYPALQKSREPHISHLFTNVMDILPTILELAGVEAPGRIFRGREVVPVRGKSWVSYLAGEKSSVYDTTADATGWELFGLRGIRRGNYKAMLMPQPRGSGEWELYNIAKDPGELENLAGEEKDKLDELLNDWEHYFAETGMFEFDLRSMSIKGI